MKTRTVEIREGELLGPIDWRYDFESHDWNHGGGTNPECVQQGISILWQIDANKGLSQVMLYDFWHTVVARGMYDGWPYWRPVPSVCLQTPLGVEWHSFVQLRGFRRKPC